MDRISEPESNSASSRLNVSFKFTKKVSQTAPGNKLEEDLNIQKDFVTHIDENKIKSTVPKDNEKDLIIPLIKKNNWRIPTSEKGENNDNQDSETKLNELAVQELLKESRERNEQWEKRDYKNDSLTIALVMQNKVPEGYETDEKMDVSLRPDESKLEDYDRIPVEKFGIAMLKGMGWKEGDAIGANCDKAVDPVQVNLRPKGLGLGADASALNKAKNKQPNEEKLVLVKGSYVRITTGKQEGFYGEVLGLDEENARVIVKLSGCDRNVTFPELSVEVVSKKEYEKESKVINRATYERYKKEHEEKEKSNDKSKKASKKDKASSKEDSHTKEERKRSHDSHKESNSKERQKHSKKSKTVEKNSDSGSYRDKSSRSWVRPQLRVRLIDDNYKKGKYFNEKVVIIDVLSPKSCTCKTEGGRYLEDVSQSMMETVIPRSEPGYVMIVQGKYSGELCTILEKNKSQCLATVQFLSDRNHAVEIGYDSICEYVGDISQYD